ncbi:hypothetical protein ACHQM5_025910 [Ranunculus cassubicifolius]
MSGTSNQEEDKKPTVTIKVKNNQDHSVVTFNVKRHSKLEKLMHLYCEHKKVDVDTFKFLYTGKRIKGHQTPHELEMENVDEIDAFLDQLGGFSTV